MKQCHSSLPAKWQTTTVQTIEQVETLRKVWQTMQNRQLRPVPHGDIDRYLAVLKGAQGQTHPMVMVFYGDSGPEAMLIGQRTKSRCGWRLGKIRLPGPKLKRMVVEYGGVLGEIGPEKAAKIVEELDTILRGGKADVIELRNLSVNSALFTTMAQRIQGDHRGLAEPIQPHRVLKLPADMAGFYQSCSKKHRGNLRRYVRKLEGDFTGQVKIRYYRGVDEWQEGLTTAASLAAKTYQVSLGGGLVDDTRTRRLWATAAKQGWLDLAVLFVGAEAAAYQYGLRYQGRYYLESIGYGPEWGNYNVGSVLFLKVLERLCEDKSIDSIDFGFGEANYKRWYGNESWREGSLLWFSRRWAARTALSFLRSRGFVKKMLGLARSSASVSREEQT